jgi:hypothetical protein
MCSCILTSAISSASYNVLFHVCIRALTVNRSGRHVEFMRTRFPFEGLSFFTIYSMLVIQTKIICKAPANESKSLGARRNRRDLVNKDCKNVKQEKVIGTTQQRLVIW